MQVQIVTFMCLVLCIGTYFVPALYSHFYNSWFDATAWHDCTRHLLTGFRVLVSLNHTRYFSMMLDMHEMAVFLALVGGIWRDRSEHKLERDLQQANPCQASWWFGIQKMARLEICSASLSFTCQQVAIRIVLFRQQRKFVEGACCVRVVCDCMKKFILPYYMWKTYWISAF